MITGKTPHKEREKLFHQFRHGKIKQLVVTYVQDAVMGATIPDISSKKEWGTYEIKGLSVESMDVDPSKLTVEVGSDVRLELTGPPACACRTPPLS